MADKSDFDDSELPHHLRDNASYLQCSKCGRKSWTGEVNSKCDIPQPDGHRCDGLMEGKLAKEAK